MKGTFKILNYLSGILYDLQPLPTDLENELIRQLICSLTQSKVNFEDDEDDQENGTAICLINTFSKMKFNFSIYLQKIIKELIRNPINLNDKILGNFNFEKLKPQHRHDDNLKHDIDFDNNERRLPGSARNWTNFSI